MKIKYLITEDFINYKLPCMTIGMPKCNNFKCGSQYCHNSELATSADIEVPVESLVTRYLNNDIAQAICFQGLEPFDTYEDMRSVIADLRARQCFDPVVIYTGYMKKEISDKVNDLKSSFTNIIIKFGRYKPNKKPHYDKVLGVTLASDNQYAKQIS